MAQVNSRGWEADDNGNLHLAYPVSPVYQEMKSFLDLESPTRSSFSLSTGEFDHADYYHSSFLLLDSVPGAVAIMAANAPSTIEKPESIASTCSARDSGHGARLGSSNSLATLPMSIRTETTCASSNSSTRSRNRHYMLPNGTRPFRRLRVRDSFTDGGDDTEHPHVGNPRHDCHSGIRLINKKVVKKAVPPPLEPQSRNTNQSGDSIQAFKPLRSSSHGRSSSSDGLPRSSVLSRDEFEALPPTIQRKYFSTLERLRITGSRHYQQIDNSGQESPDSLSFALSWDEEEDRPPLRLGFGQDELENAPHRRSRGNALRVYASPGNHLRRNRYASCDQLRRQRSRQSMILDPTKESILRMGKRQSPFESLPRSSTSPKPNPDSMMSFSADATTTAPDIKSTADSMYESFRWLEEEEDLDLKLCLDDYHFNLRGEDVTAERHRPSFRRHLSISKLPFSGRASCTLSRPTTKDTAASPPLMGSPPASSSSSPIHGHVRRRSRALSLISPNKQPVPDALVSVDAAAAHYQDPDARMKLRVYLASPHKFDEAVEFGFPSIEEVQSKEDRPRRKRASLPSEQSPNATGKSNNCLEDDKSSVYSDEASTKEPESPRTPEMMEKSLSVKPVRVSQEKDDIANKTDYAQAPAACREMTLRMTLTRPDLRANEDQIYGWQQKSSNGRKSQAKDEPLSPVSATREGHSKESIERQFATLDQEDLLANDNGVMKRFWNRVRRS